VPVVAVILIDTPPTAGAMFITWTSKGETCPLTVLISKPLRKATALVAPN